MQPLKTVRQRRVIFSLYAFIISLISLGRSRSTMCAIKAECNFFGVQTLKVPPLCCLISSVLFKKMLPAPHLWLYITNHALFLPCFNCLTVLRGYYMTKIHPSILSTLYLLYKLGLSIDILCGIDRRRLLIFLSDIVPTIRQVNHWFVKNSRLRIRSFLFFAGGSPLDFEIIDGLAPNTLVPKGSLFEFDFLLYGISSPLNTSDFLSKCLVCAATNLQDSNFAYFWAVTSAASVTGANASTLLTKA